MTTTQLRPTFAVPRQLGELFDAARLWNAADATVELSIVIPFYNPGDALRRTVASLVTCLRTQGVRFEVIAVSDGSTDGSERTLYGLAPE
ncbi:glycosyltransferase, partial [Virgisporangium aliadipatigenens]|uniref:glycosyltransferase n=1 Tax=Virgisporangium aliadipatigenens TaxID=741659 RepID=UPI001942A7E3